MAMLFVVDDEKGITEPVEYALGKEGYETRAFFNGAEAWEALLQRLPDLIILDIMMPRMDGLELCRKIRGHEMNTPIIFLSSRDEEIDRIMGLEMGGDDYLTKPFSMRELIARVKAVLKRSGTLSHRTKEGITNPSHSALPTRGERKVISDHYITVDCDAATCGIVGKEGSTALTLTELRVLSLLVSSPDTIKTREQIMASAYPEDLYPNERAADSHIKRIRKKLALLDPEFNRIESVYAMGYRYRLGPDISGKEIIR
jgi:DNA-binding response OmpR family regulator